MMEHNPNDESLVAELNNNTENTVVPSLLTDNSKVSLFGRPFSSSKRETTIPKNDLQNLFLFKNVQQQYTPMAVFNQTIKGADGMFHENAGSDGNLKPLNDDQDDGSTGTSISKPSKKTNHTTIHWSHVKEQLQLIFRIGLPYFQESLQARWLVVSLLFFSVLNNGIFIIFSFVSRDFWSALANQNATQFYSVLVLYFAILLLLMAPIYAWYTYQREQLVLHWRSWLTQRTLKLYTTHQVYYNLEKERYMMMNSNVSEDSWDRTWIDNPDQRITEDVKAFADLSISLSFELFNSIIQVGSFSAILWTIDPKLLGMAWIYALGGTVVTTILGHPLIQLNVKHLQSEADLRYYLVRFREHAEAIAFHLRATFLEHDCIAKCLQKVITNQYRINLMNRTLNLFTYTYSLSLDILPVVLVAPLYFAGKIEMGVINQSTGSFGTVVTSLSAIVYSFESITEYAANVERLGVFYQAMAEADGIKQTSWLPAERKKFLLRMANDSRPPLVGKSISMKQEEIDIETPITQGSIKDHGSQRGQRSQDYSGGHNKVTIDLQRQTYDAAYDGHATNNNSIVLQLEHLDLVTPNLKRRLIHDLNLTVEPGQHLLISGASGLGKSSLLRAIAGLWTTGFGRIIRPADIDVYFLPQQPYCTLGSLRDQLLYPTQMPRTLTMELDNESMDWRVPPDADDSSQSRPMQSNITDEDLIRILEQINLLEIASRVGDGDARQGLNVVLDWSHVLSLGERQRLAFGRLLVHGPKRLVVLDEATSALDLYNEQCMYRLLQQMAANKGSSSSDAMTYVSVGHRPSLAEFHVMRLDLEFGVSRLCYI